MISPPDVKIQFLHNLGVYIENLTEYVVHNLGVYIENLTEYVVHSPKEVLDLLEVGKSRLKFAETQMNRASSR